MVVLGVILILVGVPILTGIGTLLAIIGVVLWVLGAMGRAVGGRNHYW